jgi:hypothetical protein
MQFERLGFHEVNLLLTGECMSRIPRWFDRKFEFSFPPEQYFILCVRLRGTPARLEELVGASTRDVLLWKPQEKWSAQEHAGHLLDVEPTFAQRVADFFSDAFRTYRSRPKQSQDARSESQRAPSGRHFGRIPKRSLATRPASAHHQSCLICSRHSAPTSENPNATFFSWQSTMITI